MNTDKIMRQELLALLRGGNAHMTFDDAVSGFPMEDINREVPHGNYTVWHLLDHMRIAQWDILEFVRSPRHVSPEFPGGYWPAPDEQATQAEWEKSVEAFRADLAAMQQIVENPRIELLGPIPHAKDYFIFREILLVADHNSFHVGELVSLRRVFNMKPVKEY